MIGIARGYRRTCSSCGYSWEVTRYQAGLRLRRRNPMSRAAARGFALGSSAQRVSIDPSDPNRSGNELVEALTRCAACGSSRYTQVPVRRRDDKGE